MTRFSHIFRWDLDKTYLRTEFHGFRALLRTAFESAEEKENVPGTAALLRELRAAGQHGIFFISGSPREMRRVLERKFRMDGVSIDGLVLKPNLQNLLKGRFRALREQVGYKLPTLLEMRRDVVGPVPETLFGDDAEADAFIYSLYADLTGGRVGLGLLEDILRRAGCYKDDVERTVDLATGLPGHDPVQRIFIHLDGRSPPARFQRYGRRVVPIYNYFQVAVVLFSEGLLGTGAVVRVAHEMVELYNYELGALANSLQDLIRRGYLKRVALPALAEAVTAAGDLTFRLGPAAKILSGFAERMRGLRAPWQTPEPETEAPAIDYLAALEQDVSAHRKRRKERSRSGNRTSDAAPPKGGTRAR